MRNFIEARVKLRNVVRALKSDERGDRIGTVQAEVASMERYLDGLIREFEQKYKEISRSQSRYEARMKHAVDRSATAKAFKLPDNEPWNAITALPSVADFIAPLENPDRATAGAESLYARDFLNSLDKASSQLHAALLSEFA